MLKQFTLPVLCFFFIITVTENVLAQSLTDSVNHTKKAYTNIENNFYEDIGEQSRLFNGPEYQYYNPKFIGNPYVFDFTDWSIGSVMYDGYLYNNIKLRYDIWRDELVMPINSILNISLLNEKVESFDIMGHHFINIKNNPADPNSLKTGFYDQLYSGKIAVLASRAKSLQTQNDISGAIKNYFSGSTDYYLYKNGHYYTVNSQGAYFDALKDKKKELKQFMRIKGIKFRKTREDAMVKLAAYYDHITN